MYRMALPKRKTQFCFFRFFFVDVCSMFWHSIDIELFLLIVLISCCEIGWHFFICFSLSFMDLIGKNRIKHCDSDWKELSNNGIENFNRF